MSNKTTFSEFLLNEKRMKNDPCWKDYEMDGMKEKDGKQVPNCVPKRRKKPK